MALGYLNRRIVTLLATLTILATGFLGIQYSSTAPSVDYKAYLPSFPADTSRWRFPTVSSTSSSSHALTGRKNIIDSLYGFGEYSGRDWLSHILALDDEALAPMTKYTQQFIYDWQNPPEAECANKKFYVVSTYVNERHHGLGSVVHVTGMNLRDAINGGWILAWAEEAFGRLFFEEDCIVNGIRSLECIYEPLTSCPRKYYDNPGGVKSLARMENDPRADPLGPTPDPSFAPHVLKEKLLEYLPYPFTPAAMKYWWRGQSAAYIMRLNRPALTYLRQFRLNTTANVGFTKSSETGQVKELEMNYPLPPRTYNFHVRHGDKGAEMRLSPLTYYISAAEKHANENPNSMSRTALLTSEDPEVFTQAKEISHIDTTQTTPNMDWIYYMSHIPRINGGPFDQLDVFQNKTEITLSWMSQLMMGLECDGWVGTLGSNWNRVVDELRCIWVDGCRKTYMDVGDRNNWEGYEP